MNSIQVLEALRDHFSENYSIQAIPFEQGGFIALLNDENDNKLICVNIYDRRINKVAMFKK